MKLQYLHDQNQQNIGVLVDTRGEITSEEEKKPGKVTM